MRQLRYESFEEKAMCLASAQCLPGMSYDTAWQGSKRVKTSRMGCNRVTSHELYI